MASRFASLLLVLLATASTALAHGGEYIGPPPNWGPTGGGDIVPPAPPQPSGPAPTNPEPAPPAPAAPAAPAPKPAAPSTPSPGPVGPGPSGPAPAAATRGPSTPRGALPEPDPANWEPWWELHKDTFLRPRKAAWTAPVQSGSDEYFLGSTRRVAASDRFATTAHDVDAIVVPALQRALAAERQGDIVTACLIALAKAEPHRRRAAPFADDLAPQLAASDQEVRETAALALGIRGRRDAASIDLLAHLAADSAIGRQLCRRSTVDARTRTFACYALGLLAATPAEAAARHRCASALLGRLDDDGPGARDVQVAAIAALGLVDTSDASAASAALAARIVQGLGAFYARDLGRSAELVQAHCPPAIARLVGRDGALAAAWRDRFADDLGGKQRHGQRRSAEVARSCALALGALCRPVENDDARDADAADCLLRAAQNHHDAMTRAFAVLALGQIGGARNRDVLLQRLARSSHATELPWVALALGVHAFARRHAGADLGIGAALHDALRNTKNPSVRGALAIGLGLSGHRPAGRELLDLLRDGGDDALRGHLCIALALLGDATAQSELRDVLARSLRRPELLRQAATALSVLGDHSVTEQLLAQLHGDSNLARLSAIASALSRIGDRRSIEPLVRVLDDQNQPALSRAFAAAALGGVADPRPTPWHTALRCYVNYCAATPTLWDGSRGVLDIL